MIRQPCPLVAEGLRFADLKDGWCDHCNERVVNLSEMSERQAKKLVRKGGARCIAIERSKTGRPLFRVSRLAVLWMLFSPADAAATDVDVRTGLDAPDANGNRTVDFGLGPTPGGSLLPAESCHPHRFPHGPSGRAWVSVGRGLNQVWSRVILECREGKKRLLREKRDFPEEGERLQFTGLPTATACEIRLQGEDGTETVQVNTPDPTED